MVHNSPTVLGKALWGLRPTHNTVQPLFYLQSITIGVVRGLAGQCQLSASSFPPLPTLHIAAQWKAPPPRATSSHLRHAHA